MRSRWLALTLAASAFAAAAAGTGVRATYGARTTADEPHYLLTAISLAEDGNLDVADELSARRYLPFHEAVLPVQAAEQPSGQRLVPHDPLLAVLLAAAWQLGGWVGAKLLLAAVNAAVGVIAWWIAVRRFGARPARAAVVVGLFATSAPLAIYGTQLYPELPAALALLAAVAAATGAPRPRNVAVAALAVVALPWLAVKYVPVAAVVAVVAGVRWWRRGAPLWLLAAAAASLAVAGATYVLVHVAVYGGATVYAAGAYFVARGGELAVLGTDPDLLGRARRLSGLLVGAEFGVAAWQPAWLLTPVALGATLAAQRDGAPLLAAPLSVGWLVATFVALTMQGWWFPGRQIVVVLPLAVVAIAWWADRVPARFGLVVAAGLLGVASYAFLVVEGLRGEVTWVVDFAATANPWYRAWRLLLPDYLAMTSAGWVRHGLWSAALLGGVAWGWRSHRAPRADRRPRGAGSATAVTRSR